MVIHPQGFVPCNVMRVLPISTGRIFALHHCRVIGPVLLEAAALRGHVHATPPTGRPNYQDLLPAGRP